MSQSQKRELPKSLPMGYRSLRLRAETGADGEAKRYPITFSSDEPVKRVGWWGWYYEILGHDSGEVITDRLANGLTVLVNHDPNQRSGRLEDWKIASGRGTGEIRFGTTAFAQTIRQEVDDETLQGVSVGYVVHEYGRVADVDPDDDEDDDYLGTYRAKSWEPYEVSLTPIEADIDCGVGRSTDPDSKLPQFSVRFAGAPANPPQITPKENRSHMATPAITPTPANIEVGPDQLKVERARTAHIGLLARQYPDIVTREKQDEFIANGTDGNVAANWVLDQKRAKEIALNSGSPVTLSDKERKHYSVQRAMRSVGGSAHGFSEDKCFEREVSDEIGKKLGRDSGGLYMPTNEPLFRLTTQEMQRRSLVNGTNSAGGYTVATELVSFLDVLRPELRLFALGAEFMGGMTSNFSLPKMLTDTTFNWVGENPGSDNTDADPTFGQVQFTPKTATGSTSWSRQLLVQSSIDVEAKVRNSLVRYAAIAIESAAINGSGSSNQPKGILNATGVNAVAIGTNGGQPTKGTYIDMITKILSANAAMLGTPAYLVTPEMKGYLEKTPELSNTIALPIYYNGKINGYEAPYSNLLPKTLTKGTASGTCHASIAGVFNALTIAEWGAMEIILDPYTKARQALVNIVANFMVDVQPTYAAAFSVNLDGIPT
jgi:HK97 family phage major capsid protein